MYSYSSNSTPKITEMLYGRIKQRPGGLATYEALGTTYAATEDTTPHTTLVTPKQFNITEQVIMYQLQRQGEGEGEREDLQTPAEVADLDALVKDATEAWRGLLEGASVLQVWTEHSATTREVVKKTASGLFLPLDDDQPTREFERFHASEAEMEAIKTIESNIVAMTADRAAFGGDYI